MGLLPQFRGHGIGTKLIQSARIAARAFGLRRVELTVREHNTGAIELYKKEGFEIEGVQRDASLVDGVYENVVFMAVGFWGRRFITATLHTPPQSPSDCAANRSPSPASCTS